MSITETETVREEGKICRVINHKKPSPPQTKYIQLKAQHVSVLLNHYQVHPSIKHINSHAIASCQPLYHEGCTL
jgi:hypothetical protein